MKQRGALSLAVGVVAGAIALLALTAGGADRDPGATVTLPDRLAGYSYLTGSVSDAPPDRVVALYQHGFGVEFMDFPQAVVLAADDDVYRRLDLAETRSGPESQGDPGPMRLSPDGRWVALGDHSTPEAQLELVDLSSGDVVQHGLPEARSVLPVAWSADGNQVAYLSGEAPTNPYSPDPGDGDLFVLDLESGDAEPVPGGGGARTAAFSPDGRELAVQGDGVAIDLSIVDLPSGTVRAVSSPGTLAGPDAWSPDGHLLAVTRESSIEFLDVAGSRPSTPFHLAVVQPVVGWIGARDVVLLDSSDDNVTRLVAHHLAREDSRELTRVEGTSSYGVTRMQLASALLPDIDIRVTGDPDRGPLPAPLRFAVAALVALAFSLVAGRVTRRRPARQPPKVAGSS
jgi:hypothetical protein